MGVKWGHYTPMVACYKLVIKVVGVVCAVFFRRIRYFAPIYKFRMHYLYSNQHYGILTYLAEVLGGKKWEDLIMEHIYKPLGMTGSSFMTRADRTTQDVAQGYADDEENGGVIPVPEEINK